MKQRAELEESRRDCLLHRTEYEKLRATFAELAKNAEAAAITQLSDDDSVLSCSGATKVGALSQSHEAKEEVFSRIAEVHARIGSINKTNFSVFCGDVPRLITEILPVLHAVKPDTENALALTLDIVEQLATCLSWACGVQSRGPSRGASPPPALGPLPASPTIVHAAKRTTSTAPSSLRSSFELPLPMPIERPPPRTSHTADLHKGHQSLASLDAGLPSPQPTPRSSVTPSLRKPPAQAASPRNTSGTVAVQRGSLVTRSHTTASSMLPLPAPRPVVHNTPLLLLDDDADVEHPADVEPAIMVSRRRTTAAPSHRDAAPLNSDFMLRWGHPVPSSRQEPHLMPPKHSRAPHERSLLELSPNQHTPPLKRSRTEAAHHDRSQVSPGDLIGF
jgi:hypothetical protein